MGKSFRERGGGWVLIQWVLMLALLVVAPLESGRAWGAAALVAAAVWIATGAFLGIAGVVALRGSRTIYPEPPEGASLVRHGIFAFVRHPLYASLIFLSFGWACAWSSTEGIWVAVVMAFFLDAKARHEERRLRARFPEYPEYSGKVKRLLPWIY